MQPANSVQGPGGDLAECVSNLLQLLCTGLPPLLDLTAAHHFLCEKTLTWTKLEKMNSQLIVGFLGALIVKLHTVTYRGSWTSTWDGLLLL